MLTQTTASLRFYNSPVSRPASQSDVLGAASLASSVSFYGCGEELYGQGEPIEFVYEVVSGAVRSFKLLSDGRRQIGAFHMPGDLLGLEGGRAHQLTAEAMIDSRVRGFSRRGLEAAASCDAGLAHRLWVMTEKDLHHAKNHMLLLGRKSAMERVAAFLLEMDVRLAQDSTLILPMPRRDIADYLGLTLETVSRTLSQLQKEGKIDLLDARHIIINERGWLRSINI